MRLFLFYYLSSLELFFYKMRGYEGWTFHWKQKKKTLRKSNYYYYYYYYYLYSKYIFTIETQYPFLLSRLSTYIWTKTFVKY